MTVLTIAPGNPSAGVGVALREVSLSSGEPDYLLFVSGKAVGTVEAKPANWTLSEVESQSTKYVTGVPFGFPAWRVLLPFCYETTGEKSFFTNRLETLPRSREVFTFHRPETLLEWAQEPEPLSKCLRTLPPLLDGAFWPAQATAIQSLERSLAAVEPRALIQMATGSGKIFTAVNFHRSSIFRRGHRL